MVVIVSLQDAVKKGLEDDKSITDESHEESADSNIYEDDDIWHSESSKTKADRQQKTNDALKSVKSKAKSSWESVLSKIFGGLSLLAILVIAGFLIFQPLKSSDQSQSSNFQDLETTQRTLWREAKQLYKDGQPEAAISKLEKAISLDSTTNLALESENIIAEIIRRMN